MLGKENPAELSGREKEVHCNWKRALIKAKRTSSKAKLRKCAHFKTCR